jgi:glycosyltransferase involved in cell wall biosynthesis
LKKRVLHIAQFLSYGSAKGIMAILLGQKRAGEQLELLLAEAFGDFFHSPELLAELAKEGIRVDFVDSTFRRDSDCLERMRQKLRQDYPPEKYVCFTHGGFAALALSECGHDFWHICHGLGLNRPQWIEEQDRQGILAAGQVFAVSADIKRQLVELSIPAERTEVVYYPLEIRQRKEPVSNSVQKIGVVGNMVPLKGHEYALRAFSLLPERSGCELHFFGDGPLRADLENLALELGLDSEEVFFHGFVKTEQAFNSIDLLLQPSLKEGLGMTIAEAYEYGVAVCAFDAGGIGEMVQDGKTGFLCPVRAAEALATNIMKYRQNPDLRTRHVTAGLQHIQTMFDPSKNTTGLLNAVRRVRDCAPDEG